jgi:hypothetical protein
MVLDGVQTATRSRVRQSDREATYIVSMALAPCATAPTLRQPPAYFVIRIDKVELSLFDSRHFYLSSSNTVILQDRKKMILNTH